MRGNLLRGRSAASPLGGERSESPPPALSAAVLRPHDAISGMLSTARATASVRSFTHCDMFLAALSMHLAAAEEVLYPALRRWLPDGRALAADQVRLAHDVERTMRLIQGSFYGDIHAISMSRGRLWQEMAWMLDAHASAEEESVTRLEEVLAPRERWALVDAFEAAERHAPTRPHPYAPHSALMGRLTRRAWSLADRMMDAMDNRAVPRTSPRPPPTRDSLWAHYLLGVPLADLPSAGGVRRERRPGVDAGAPSPAREAPPPHPARRAGRRRLAAARHGRVGDLVRRYAGR